MAATNTSVTIKGINLSGTTAVSFGGIPAQYIFNVSDSIVIAVTGGGASGSVNLTTLTGTASLAGFTFLPPPSIISFTPISALSGTTISIKGHFLTGITSINFGDVPAKSFNLLNDSTVTAVVGNGSTGDVNIANTNGTGRLAGFVYLGPNITSFNPTTGGSGTIVNITGANFTGATDVKFGGVASNSFTVNSPGNITAITGFGATGDVTVTTPTGTGTKSGFLAPPHITDVAPLAAPVSSPVIIKGNSFVPDIYANTVYFGTTKATITSATSTMLTVAVPSAGAYQPISVNANGLTGYSGQPFITTFAGGTFNGGSFALRQSPNFSISPLSATIADLDYDGKPDAVTANADGSLSILKNNSSVGYPSFMTPVTLPSNGNYNATGVAVADFDGDGYMEIALINYGYNVVSIFKNFSYGPSLNFTKVSDIPTGINPRNITVADMDGDGKPDIIVTNYNDASISVLRNTSLYSNITFATRVNIATGTNPYLVTIADFNNDGKPDMAVTIESSALISVFTNTSSSGILSFSSKTDYATGSGCRGIATGDLDGDGLIDLVSSNAGDNSISILKNNSLAGNINFLPKVNMLTGHGPNSITVNDFNGDGKPDLAVTTFTDSAFNIFPNISSTGNIAFAPEVTYPTGTNTSFNFSSDIDGDGKPDIISIDQVRLSWLRNKLNEPPVINSFAPATVFSGDTIIIKGTGFSGAISVNVGASSFSSFTVLSDSTIAAVAGTGNGNISVTTPDGSAISTLLTITEPPKISNFIPLSGPVGTIITINGKGFIPGPLNNTVSFGTAPATIVSATSTSIMAVVPTTATQERITVTCNKLSATSSKVFNIIFAGAGALFTKNYFDTASKLIVPGISGISNVSVGDIDGDGKTDVAVNEYLNKTSNFYVFQNYTSENNILFGAEKTQAITYDAPGQILIKDINGDNKPDFLVASFSDLYLVSILKNASNTGTISVSNDMTVTYPRPSQHIIETADFDGDGRPDLLVQSIYNNDIQVFRNTTKNDIISFAAPITTGAVDAAYFAYAQTVMVEDFNEDGRPDIAITTAGHIAIFRNIGAIGSIVFAPVQYINNYGATEKGAAADIDGDGKIDILQYFSANKLSVLRNIGTGTIIDFETPVIINAPGFISNVVIKDLDGDAKPDISMSYNNSIFSVFKNKSTIGNIAFATNVDYPTNTYSISYSIADINNDGKPEILISNQTSNVITILKNIIGDPSSLVLCPPLGNTSILADLTGATYQWQVNNGSGYVNVTDNSNYSNAKTAMLQLNNIPTSYNGYLYRCVVDGSNSNVSEIKFLDKWTGSLSSAWENSANWSCGFLPDANTDVIINSGTAIINSNVTLRSLVLAPGVSLTVNSGFTLTVLH